MKKKDFINLSGEYDVVNIGSGPSEHDFNWSGLTWIRGYNLAVSPEDFRYDKRILHNYKHHIKKNGVVIIVICPLSFAENKYVYDDLFSYKYVDILPQSAIDLPPIKYRIYKNKIGQFLIDNIYRIRAIPDLIVDSVGVIGGRHKPLEEKLIFSWLKDNPYILNFKEVPSRDMSTIFETKKNDLIGIVTECFESEIRPILLIPPISKTLYSFFAPEFLELYLYQNVNEVKNQVQVLDYMCDARFNEDQYFTNGLFLKKEIAPLFTLDVWRRVKNEQ